MQLTFGDAEGLGKRKQTRREIFLGEMEQVVPWKSLLALIEPHYPPSGRRGRPPYALATMLRIQRRPRRRSESAQHQYFHWRWSHLPGRALQPHIHRMHCGHHTGASVLEGHSGSQR